MDKKEIIKNIKTIKKDIKNNKATKIYCGGSNIIHPLEIAARFLRRKGFHINIAAKSIPIGLVKSNGDSVNMSRYTVIEY